MSKSPVQQPSPIKHIVFFDGICALCNSFIDFLMRIDRKNVLQFAPLQGSTAGEYNLKQDADQLSTVIFYSNGVIFTKSDAVIEIMKTIGGIWKLASVLKIMPKKIRDHFYTYVANNRLKWFGQKESCRMPTEKERGRILN